MALMGPDGDTHSHLNYPQHPQGQASAPGAHLPDRGHWVGPRGGQREAQPPIPAESGPAPFGPVLDARGGPVPGACDALRYVLEHQPMTAPQRRILLEALTVLESFR